MLLLFQAAMKNGLYDDHVEAIDAVVHGAFELASVTPSSEFNQGRMRDTTVEFCTFHMQHLEREEQVVNG